MFGPHKPDLTRSLNGGVQHKFKFANGYGASVVRHDHSYGREQGLWELAVLGLDGHLTYETPVTNDVLGYLSDSDVAAALDQIEALYSEAIVEAQIARERQKRDERIAALESELARLKAAQVSA